MRRSFLPLVAISSLLFGAVAAHASSRPRYGGTVRVLLRHKLQSLDPLQESADTADRDRIGNLLFECLTEIDAQGRTVPKLATSWQVDAARRVWQFNLRSANFHDGSPLTAAAVAASMKAVNADWKVTFNGRQAFTLETPYPAPHLLEMLALSRFSIIKRLPDGTLSGTGPYTLAEWRPGERALLAANAEHWGGRPFPDNIDFRMGLSLREHLMERSLGFDHAVELGVDQVRALEQSGQTLQISRPSDILVLVFLSTESAPRPGRRPIDPRVREALSKSINRTAISNVLLQRRGAPAGGLLPQWMTGYEFLFPSNQDMERARELRAEAGPILPFSIAYDAADSLMKQIADRIAVDAREAGITVQDVGDLRINTPSGRSGINADAILLRLPLSSLDPAAALFDLADGLALPSDDVSAIVRSARPEDLVEAERKALADYRVVPVVHLSQVVWTNGSTHNWQQLPNGEWRLEQLWVEGTR